MTQAAIPTHWALHHTTQPAELRGCSIAVVNSIGNLGGFLGPFMLGAMHDAAPSAPCGKCLAQWGGGLFSVGVYLLTATAVSRLVIIRCAPEQKPSPTERSAVESQSSGRPQVRPRLAQTRAPSPPRARMWFDDVR